MGIFPYLTEGNGKQEEELVCFHLTTFLTLNSFFSANRIFYTGEYNERASEWNDSNLLNELGIESNTTYGLVRFNKKTHIYTLDACKKHTISFIAHICL
jgi:hypothetical protein